jgi:hypothetical protein
MEAVGRSRNSTALQLGRTTVVAGTPASGANTERPADQPRLGTTSRTPSPGSPRQCVASDATRLQPSRTRSRPVSFSWFEAIGCCLAHSHLDHAGHGVREALEQLPAERATGSVDGDNPSATSTVIRGRASISSLRRRSRSARTSSSPRAIRRSGSRRATMPTTRSPATTGTDFRLCRSRIRTAAAAPVSSVRCVHRPAHHLTGGVERGPSGCRVSTKHWAGRGVQRKQVGLGHDADLPDFS